MMGNGISQKSIKKIKTEMLPGQEKDKGGLVIYLKKDKATVKVVLLPPFGKLSHGSKAFPLFSLPLGNKIKIYGRAEPRNYRGDHHNLQQSILSAAQRGAGDGETQKVRNILTLFFPGEVDEEAEADGDSLAATNKFSNWVRQLFSFSFSGLYISPPQSQKKVTTKEPTMGEVAVVVDNGSAFCRAGFAGQDKPKTAMKMTYLPPILLGANQDQLLAYTRNSQDSTTESRPPPIKHGIIKDWEAMEHLWSHLFYCGLRVSPEQHPMLMSTSPSSPTTNREKTAEVLFESFGIPALYIANTGFLSLCSCGRLTGLAMEAGAGVSHVTPIYSGQTWMKGTYRLDVAGRLLCKYLHSLLLNGPQLIGTLDKKTVARLKRQHCYVSMDYEKDLQAQTCSCPVTFESPDGHWMKLDKERFRCPEPLFRPHLLNQSSPGLHLLAFQSLQKLPEEYKGQVLNNIVLSGGSSMFPGFSERMCLELDTLFHGNIRILAAPQRSTAAWKGGSLVASLSSFHHFWMRKEDYQEHGATYVHEKFRQL